jgi:ATP-dependent Clp protease protease subunit
VRRRAGKRYAFRTRIMMHQPSGGIGGTASDIRIQAEQMPYTKKKMAELIAQHTGQNVDQIEEDSDRDGGSRRRSPRTRLRRPRRPHGRAVSGSGGTAA